jgi:drug/metabolite transporter (DMT)-like permease
MILPLGRLGDFLVGGLRHSEIETVPTSRVSMEQWLLLAFLSILWGGSFFFVAVAVQELRVLTLVLARVAIAAALLAMLVFAMRIQLPRKARPWLTFMVMALLNNVIPFTGITVGQKHVTSGLASVLIATTPVWSLLLGHFVIGDERLQAHRLVGILLGLGGTAILVGPEALLGDLGSAIGIACVLAAALSYALAAIWGRRFRGMSPLVAAAAQLTCSTVVLLPLALFVDQPWTMVLPSAQAILAVLGLAVFATALAYVVFFRTIAALGPTNVMLVTLLVPMTAVFLGAFFLDEAILPHQVVGAAVIGCSLLIIDGRLFAFVSTLWHARQS